MHAFEFQAQPKDGRIEIPAEYQDKIAGTVRVIILSSEKSAVIVETAKTGDAQRTALELREIAESMRANSFAGNPPRFTREELHERR